MALRAPREPIRCSLRQLESSTPHNELPPNPSASTSPSNYEQPIFQIFPTKPLGLVDFIGFDGSGYVPHRLPPDECEDRANWRDYELEWEETANKTLQHPSFQPLIKVVNEVAELEICGPLLEYKQSRNVDYLDSIGIPQLGGQYRYIDKITGEWLLSPRSHDPERVTLTFGYPGFYRLLKGPVWEYRESYGYKGRPLGIHRFLVEDAQDEYWDATEAELDQVVCRSPYFKLSHEHHGEFQPKGSAR